MTQPSARGSSGAKPAAAPVDAPTAEPAAPPAFEALFTTQFPIMFRLAHLLGAADPENVAQEAFVRLHARWRHLADPTRAGGYLRATVVNLCRSAARHDAVAARHDATEPEPPDEPSAEDMALQAVSDRALLTALGALAPRHREALVLRFWLDLSERDMADAMNCSTGSVKAHVSRGLSALRAAMVAAPPAETPHARGDSR